MMRQDFSVINTKKPKKSLLKKINKISGRDSFGKISIHHRGGGHKRKYRIISSLQDFIDTPATVKTIEYDPNRTARIMLVQLDNNMVKYLLAPDKIKIGDKIICSDNAKLATGNRLKLKNILTGTEIYDIEITPNSRGRLVRSAGSSAIVLSQQEGNSKKSNYIQIKLPSGEIRLIHKECYASIGKVSNTLHSTIKIGKAGRKRWMGIRPTVRGKAKNPCDHPHGGGEGGSPIGLKYPKTATGKHALGKITRRNKRTNKFIIKRRFKK
jgi:large subunit ribosomal protein L2